VEQLAELVGAAPTTKQLIKVLTEKRPDGITRQRLSVSVLCRQYEGVWDVLNADVDYDGVRGGHRPEEELSHLLAGLDPGEQKAEYGRLMNEHATQLRSSFLRAVRPESIDGHDLRHDTQALQVAVGQTCGLSEQCEIGLSAEQVAQVQMPA
jgi:hypothetical protein